MSMPPMLAYTITSSLSPGTMPQIVVGQGTSKAHLKPDSPADDSYWFCIMDAKNPKSKVKEFVVAGSSNASVPNGLDAYMSNPAYIIAVVTQYLSSLHVPQGAFYNYLVQHGAGRELQRLEQLNTSLGCGSIGRMSYILTMHGGSSFGYEHGDTVHAAQLLKSLMPGKDGQPPYSICDHYTFNT